MRLLSDDEQLWLLVAAADSTGNLDLIQATGGSLGLPARPGTPPRRPASSSSLPTVRFRHPLVRSAVYGAAPGGERRRVHAALAAAAEDLGRVELEAWHAAKATARDRRGRGGPAGAGRRPGRAARRRASRASVLAQAVGADPGRVRSGTPAWSPRRRRRSRPGAAQLAASMLDEVDERQLDPLSTGRMLAVRASVAVFTGDPALRRSGADMLAAAEAMHGHDAGLEQDTLLQAFYFTLPAERLAAGLSPRRARHPAPGGRPAERRHRRDDPAMRSAPSSCCPTRTPYPRCGGPWRRSAPWTTRAC